MGLRVYLPVAAVVSLAATIGADCIASMSIAGQPFAAALHQALYWDRVEFVGTIFLLVPFVAVAFVCALVEKRARNRSALLIFAVAMIALLYFYFRGYQAAEHAALQKLWTAAAVSIGFLPFGIGLAVVLAVIVFGWLATEFDPRVSD